ncbi:MAG: HAD family hydrolase [Candidatus Thiodiazotropha sp. (ex Notomyrtea botanica)]|nr:HAD family hydrolase [Candidatus Thiodiazotropha sp. (ex Notomyrtea botanica)]
MHHIMFDVDGTLVQSYAIDEACYVKSVSEVLGHSIDTNWSKYRYVTDSGILKEHLERNDIFENHDEIFREVKSVFIEKIKHHLLSNPASEIAGASAFISQLKELNSVSLSIATGGWLETAKLKLESASIDVSDIPIASSDDHHSRIEIMKAAKNKANVKGDFLLTYFGDASWDQKACSELGYNFILVGNRIKNGKAVNDLTNINQILSLIGL